MFFPYKIHLYLINAHCIFKDMRTQSQGHIACTFCNSVGEASLAHVQILILQDNTNTLRMLNFIVHTHF